MESLPDFQLPLFFEGKEPSQKEIFNEYKHQLHSNLLEALNKVQKRFRSCVSQVYQRINEVNVSQSISKQNTETITKADIPFRHTKTTIYNLVSEIKGIEKLLFLVRYFNIDNLEAYNTLVVANAAESSNMMYNLNKYIQKWIRSLHKATNKSQELRESQQRKTSNIFYQNNLDPSRYKDNSELLEELKTSVMGNYYKLDSTYDIILEELSVVKAEILKHDGVNEPMKLYIGNVIEEKAIQEQLIGESFAVLEMQSEIDYISQLREEVIDMEYLNKTKAKIDDILKKFKMFEDDLKDKAKKLLLKNIAEQENKEEGFVSQLRFDQKISKEIDSYVVNGSNIIRAFLSGFREQIRQKVVKLVSLDKFLVQAAYISFFFEERFVVFHAGKDDFAKENIPKILQDFFMSADKEYWKLSGNKSDIGLHALYFCYVAQNKHDFYLFKYDANSGTIQIYMTAVPMVSALHKHLSKLDLKTFSKTNFHITLINFYDMDLNVEFRNLFLKGHRSESIEESEVDGISGQMRYLVFATIFILHNTPIQPNEQGLSFTAMEFITFFNYLSEFQIEFLKNADMQEVSFSIDFCYPFQDKNNSKSQSFLTYDKKDPLYEKGIYAVRSLAYANKNLFKYQDLSGGDIFNADIYLKQYLSKNNKKRCFTLDSAEYLTYFLQKRKHAKTLCKVFTKEEGQIIYNFFINEIKKEKDTLEKVLDLETQALVVYVPFVCKNETNNLLLIILDKNENSIKAYTHRNSISDNPDNLDTIKGFILYIATIFHMDHDKLNIMQIICIGDGEITFKYKDCYFSLLSLLDKQYEGLEMIELKPENYVQSFEIFLYQAVLEKRLDLLKTAGMFYQEKLASWKIANIGTFWKLKEVKYALESFIIQMSEESLDSGLISFNFQGFSDLKTYYVHFHSHKEAQSINNYNKSFLLDLYSISSNLEDEDIEIIALVNYISKTMNKCQILINSASRMSANGNIMLEKQVDLTLSSLSYCVHHLHIPLQDAFKKIGRSLISQYEVLEDLAEEINPSRTHDMLGDLNEIQASIIETIKESVPFSERLKEAEVKKHIQGIAIQVLEKLEVLKLLGPNLEDVLKKMNTVADNGLDSFAFVVNEELVNKIIKNEGNVINNKQLYSDLVNNIKTEKKKYEDITRKAYSKINIFFIFQKNLININEPFMVKYTPESHEFITYFMEVSDVQEEVKILNHSFDMFIEKLDVAINSQSSEKKFGIIKSKLAWVVVPESLAQIQKSHLSLTVKFVLWMLYKNRQPDEEKINLPIDLFNSFICEYANELFSAIVENSLIKEQYPFFCNVLLEKNSKIVKNPALINSNPKIVCLEQFSVVKNCLCRFYSEYSRLEGIGNAFFFFGIRLRDSIKQFILHINRSTIGKLTLQLFTNRTGDVDVLIEKLIIQSFIKISKKSSSDASIAKNDTINAGRTHGLNEVLVYRFDITNPLFTKYIEISAFLIAQTICNDSENPSNYVQKLVYSPIHFIEEIQNIENNCYALGIVQRH